MKVTMYYRNSRSHPSFWGRVVCFFFLIDVKSKAGLCAPEGCISNHRSFWKDSPVERKDHRQKEHFRTVFVQSQDCLKCGGGDEDRYFTRAVIFHDFCSFHCDLSLKCLKNHHEI